jgi:hypothetical protein
MRRARRRGLRITVIIAAAVTLIGAWDRSLFWSYERCSTNDFVPYTLGPYWPGGIHHHTVGYFTDTTPWTPNRDVPANIWGHYDGTWDRRA